MPKVAIVQAVSIPHSPFFKGQSAQVYESFAEISPYNFKPVKADGPEVAAADSVLIFDGYSEDHTMVAAAKAAFDGLLPGRWRDDGVRPGNFGMSPA